MKYGNMYNVRFSDELCHHGVKGQRWGVIKEKVKEAGSAAKSKASDLGEKAKSKANEASEWAKNKFSGGEASIKKDALDSKKADEMSKQILGLYFQKKLGVGYGISTIADAKKKAPLSGAELSAHLDDPVYDDFTSSDKALLLDSIDKNYQSELVQYFAKNMNANHRGRRAPDEDTSTMSRMRHGALCHGALYAVKFK